MGSRWIWWSAVLGAALLPAACAGEELEPTDGASGEGSAAVGGHGGSGASGKGGATSGGTGATTAGRIGVAGSGSTAVAGKGGSGGIGGSHGGTGNGNAGRGGTADGGVGPLGGSAGEVTAGEGGGLGDAGHGGEPCTSCAGGTAGSGGIAATMLYDFDVDEQGWNVQYSAAGSLLNGDPATSIPLSSVITQWTTGNGFGDGGGALKITVPYTSEAQYVGIGLHLNAEDLSGKIITAHVKLVTGLEDPTDLPMNPAGAKIYAKAGVAYTYAAGAFSNVDTVGKWLTLRFDLGDRTTWSYEDTTNDAFDPSQVGEVGVQFDTGGATTTAQTAVLLIDSVSW